MRVNIYVDGIACVIRKVDDAFVWFKMKFDHFSVDLMKVFDSVSFEVTFELFVLLGFL